MSAVSELVDRARARFAAVPIDRAPLRRAGLLTLALVALVVGMPLLMPTRPVPMSSAERQTLQETPETGSARPAKRGGSGGRIFALLLLAGVGAYAFSQRKRADTQEDGDSSLDILESVALGPGQSLRLVACGNDVLLLSVGPDGVRLVRDWTRQAFIQDGQELTDFVAPLGNEEHVADTPFPEAAPRIQPVRGVLFPAAPTREPAIPTLHADVDEAPAPGSFAATLRQFQVDDV